MGGRRASRVWTYVGERLQVVLVRIAVLVLGIALKQTRDRQVGPAPRMETLKARIELST